MQLELTRQRQLFGAKPFEIQGVIDLVMREKLFLQLEIEVVKKLQLEQQADIKAHFKAKRK